MKKGDHLFLVDGSGYIFRAYHALPPLTRKSDGLPVGAVSGFCNMLWKLMKDARNTDVGIVPTHFAVIFDYSSKTFRNELYSEYKANRSAPPDDLIPQFGLIRQATRAFDLPCIEIEGFEADDLIATYARLACEAGGDTTIISSDKDLMQLVGATVSMYDPMKDKQIGVPEVIEKWGVPPEKMIDLQSLTGDSVDNVPGVPGIGEKAAAQLLSEIPSLEHLIGEGANPEKVTLELEERSTTLLAVLRDLAGFDLNPNSAQQVGKVLKEKFGVSDLPSDKKGSLSPKSEGIERLARNGNLFCQDVIRARGLLRSLSSTIPTVIDNADKARISRDLVRLKDDVPLTEGLDDFALQPPNGPKLISFLKAMEFSSLTRRVAETTGTEPSEIEAARIVVQTGDEAHGPDVGSAPTSPLWGGRAEGAGGGDDGTQSTPTPALRADPPHSKGEGNATPAALAAARAHAAVGVKIDRAKFECIRDLATLQAWVAEAKEAGQVAFRAETTSLDPMQAEPVGFSLAIRPGRAAYVPVAHRASEADLLGGGRAPNQVSLEEALAALRPLLTDASVLKVGHNSKFDWLLMHRLGVDIAPFDDTMLMSYVLDAGTGHHSLDSLAERWLGHAVIPFKDIVGSGRNLVTFDLVDIERATTYSTEGADLALRLWLVLKPRLTANGLVSVYERLERPLVPVLAKMEERGISVDRQMLSRLSGELAQRAAALEDEVYTVAGERFTIGSPKQLGDILFGRMGLPGGSKTKSGQWSTTAQVLEELATEGYELPRKIVDWRQLTKLKSTYTDALPDYIHPDTRRVHTSYAMASTSTGRLSSNEPNLQNIPIRTSEGRKVRTAFIAEKGNKLISADYSQIELRILAHVADIPQLKAAFANGDDIHAMTASEMFNVPVAGMPREVRNRAKAINFGIVYGISAFGLANQLSIPREEAGAYIKRYFERFPGIRDYMDRTKAFCRETGYVETIFGRRAHYPEIRASNPSIRANSERAAINAPIQGSAADIIRRAMARMDAALSKAGLPNVRMLLQVHDELVFEARAEEVDAAMPVIRRVMEDAAMPAINLAVPLHVDARAADNWDEAH